MMQCHAESVEILQADFKEGDRVLITEGVLQGQIGKLITLKGKSKVAIHLEDLQADILIEIPQNQIRKILPNT
jgi:transcription antitermination factor NusG